MNALLVGFGGFAGSLARYGVGYLAQRWLPGASLPAATIFVNLVGCLIVGLVTRLGEPAGGLPEHWRAFLVVGILGGFTTFSAFGYETVAAVRAGHHLAALASVTIQILGGFGCVFAGRALASWLVGPG